MLIKKDRDCDPGDCQYRETEPHPKERTLFEHLPGCCDRAFKASADSPLAKEPIVMTLNKIGLNLAHRIQNDANDNQKACTSEKTGCHTRDAGECNHRFRKNRDQR